MIAGVDEAGRGPLAGSVVAAAVILPEGHGIEGLTDSKKLTEKKREALFELIKARASSFAICEASVAEIDEINILQASLLAMRRAVLALDLVPTQVLVDGNKTPDVPYPVRAIVKGDLTEESISAASILAKVTRDRQMLALDEQYPGYGFKQHKGYPTKAHIDALRVHGVSAVHRRTFGPVKALLTAEIA